MNRRRVLGVWFAGLLVVASGCSGDDSSSEVIESDEVSTVSDAFQAAGADEQLADCYGDAYAAAGVTDIDAPSDLVDVQSRELEEALAACLELINP